MSTSKDDLLDLVQTHFALSGAVELLEETDSGVLMSYCAGMIAGAVLTEDKSEAGQNFRVIFEKRKREVMDSFGQGTD